MSASSDVLVAAIDETNDALQHLVTLCSSYTSYSGIPEMETLVQTLLRLSTEFAEGLEESREHIGEFGRQTSYMERLFCGAPLKVAAIKVSSFLEMKTLAMMQASSKIVARAQFFTDRRNMRMLAASRNIVVVPPSFLSWAAAFERGIQRARRWASSNRLDIVLSVLIDHKEQEDMICCPDEGSHFPGLAPPQTSYVAAILELLRGELETETEVFYALRLLDNILKHHREASFYVQQLGGVCLLLKLLQASEKCITDESMDCLEKGVRRVPQSNMDVVTYNGIPILMGYFRGAELYQDSYLRHLNIGFANHIIVLHSVVSQIPKTWESIPSAELLSYLTTVLSHQRWLKCLSPQRIEEDAITMKLMLGALERHPEKCESTVRFNCIQSLVSLLKYLRFAVSRFQQTIWDVYGTHVIHEYWYPNAICEFEAKTEICLTLSANLISLLSVQLLGAKAVFRAGGVSLLARFLQHKSDEVRISGAVSLLVLMQSFQSAQVVLQKTGTESSNVERSLIAILALIDTRLNGANLLLVSWKLESHHEEDQRY